MKAIEYFDKIEELITIMVYKGGELPQDGEKIYEQQFVINKKVDEEWIYFPLEKPFFIPEGENFYIIITHPVTFKYLGFDNSYDENVLKNCFSGVYQGNGKYYWYPGYTQSEYSIWKIRPLTASGKNQWLTLDTQEGVIPAGATVAVNATVNPEIAGKGTHIGKIIAKSNDINNPKDEVTITLNVNGAPELKFYPNIYNDTSTKSAITLSTLIEKQALQIDKSNQQKITLLVTIALLSVFFILFYNWYKLKQKQKLIKRVNVVILIIVIILVVN